MSARRWRRAAGCVAAATTSLMAAGCGGGGAPALPAGFTRYQDAKLSFGYPSSWTLHHRPAATDHPAEIEVLGPKGGSGVAPQILVGNVNTVNEDLSPAAGLKAVTSASAAQDAIQLHDWHEVKSTVVTVPKARAANLRIAEFTEQAPDGATLTVRMFDLEAVRRPNVVYSFQAAASVAEADSARLQQIVDTFRFR